MPTVPVDSLVAVPVGCDADRTDAGDRRMWCPGTQRSISSPRTDAHYASQEPRSGLHVEDHQGDTGSSVWCETRDVVSATPLATGRVERLSAAEDRQLGTGAADADDWGRSTAGCDGSMRQLESAVQSR